MILFLLIELKCYSQVDTFENDIVKGAHIFMKFQDSLVFKGIASPVLVYVVNLGYPRKCESKNTYTIEPVYSKEDLIFRKYNSEYFHKGRYVLMQQDLVKMGSSFYPLKSDAKLNCILDKESHYESRFVLEYTPCNDYPFEIKYSEGSRHFLKTPILFR